MVCDIVGIADFLLDRKNKHGNEVDKDYRKRCNKKIKELCGGLISPDSFVERAKRYRIADSYTATYEKYILKFECRYGSLKFEDIEDRLDELLQMDTVTLFDITFKGDSSKFKTQKDIEDYMGEGYVCKLKGKLKPNSFKIYSKYANLTKEQIIEHERQMREQRRLAREKREEQRRGGGGQREEQKRLAREKREEERLERERQREERRRLAREKREEERLERERQREEQRIAYLKQVKEFENNEIPKEKLDLIKRGSADIEIYRKVKSNTALASTALFLVTGVFVAEAKEEMKYVKTQIK